MGPGAGSELGSQEHPLPPWLCDPGKVLYLFVQKCPYHGELRMMPLKAVSPELHADAPCQGEQCYPEVGFSAMAKSSDLEPGDLGWQLGSALSWLWPWGKRFNRSVPQFPRVDNCNSYLPGVKTK